MRRAYARHAVIGRSTINVECKSFYLIGFLQLNLELMDGSTWHIVRTRLYYMVRTTAQRFFILLKKPGVVRLVPRMWLYFNRHVVTGKFVKIVSNIYSFHVLRYVFCGFNVFFSLHVKRFFFFVVAWKLCDCVTLYTAVWFLIVCCVRVFDLFFAM